jgi:hypothetical protein
VGICDCTVGPNEGLYSEELKAHEDGLQFVTMIMSAQFSRQAHAIRQTLSGDPENWLCREGKLSPTFGDGRLTVRKITREWRSSLMQEAGYDGNGEGNVQAMIEHHVVKETHDFNSTRRLARLVPPELSPHLHL